MYFTLQHASLDILLSIAPQTLVMTHSTETFALAADMEELQNRIAFVAEIRPSASGPYRINAQK